MAWFVFVSVYFLFSHSTVSVAGQCTVSGCAVSLLGCEESLQFSLEEHDHRLETMNQNMYSAYEKLEAAVKRTNARVQEELHQDLKTLYYNMSVNFDRLNEKIPERFERHRTQEQEKYLRILNLSMTSMIVRTDERILTVNENLQNINTSLDEIFQVMKVQLQGQSSALQTVNRSLDEKFQVMQAQIQTVNRSLDEKFQVMQVQIQAVNRSLDEKFQVMQVQIQTVNRSLDEKFQVMQAQIQTVNRSLDEKFQVMQVQIQTVNRSLDEKLQVMQYLLSSLVNESIDVVLRDLNQKFQALSSAIDEINGKLNATFDRVKDSNPSAESQDHCRNTSDVCDCSNIKANGYTTSGVYRIYVVDQGKRYYANALCDMTTTNGAWTVFQRRKDGSVGFYRGWYDYANGFGDPNGEFWLGNNFLHLLTSKRRYRLRIDLEDFQGGRRYAEYSTFSIGSSADKYRLGAATYSGNSGGDSLSDSNGQLFTTEDNDNDGKLSMNCAVKSHGPWWYHDCSNVCGYSNLNGLYLRGSYSSNGSFNGMEGIYWDAWHGRWYSLKTTEMKIFS